MKNLQGLWPVARAAMFVVLVARGAMVTIENARANLNTIVIYRFSDVLFLLFQASNNFNFNQLIPNTQNFTKITNIKFHLNTQVMYRVIYPQD